MKERLVVGGSRMKERLVVGGSRMKDLLKQHNLKAASYAHKDRWGNVEPILGVWGFKGCM